jgi:hypothetical protein
MGRKHKKAADKEPEGEYGEDGEEGKDGEDEDKDMEAAMARERYAAAKIKDMKQTISKQEAAIKVFSKKVETLSKEAAIPKIRALETLYASAEIDEDELTPIRESWNTMGLTELDSEIKRIKPFAREASTQLPPLEPTTPKTYEASAKNILGDLGKQSALDILNGGRI